MCAQVSVKLEGPASFAEKPQEESQEEGEPGPDGRRTPLPFDGRRTPLCYEGRVTPVPVSAYPYGIPMSGRATPVAMSGRATPVNVHGGGDPSARRPVPSGVPASGRATPAFADWQRAPMPMSGRSTPSPFEGGGGAAPGGPLLALRSAPAAGLGLTVAAVAAAMGAAIGGQEGADIKARPCIFNLRQRAGAPELVIRWTPDRTRTAVKVGIVFHDSSLHATPHLSQEALMKPLIRVQEMQVTHTAGE